jgi:outer membrane protein assembly factor BamC
MKLKQTLLSLAGLTLLGACASSDTGFYKHAPSIKPLDVPPDLTAPEIKDDFNIPQIGVLLSDEPLLIGGGKVSLKKDGRLRWLEIEADRELVWQKVRDFFVENEVELDWENLGLGLMETEWVSHYETAFARDKFRIRLEPGQRDGVSELYISHRGQHETMMGGEIVPTWWDRDSDDELEIEVLGQLLAFMGLSPEQRKLIKEQAKPEKVGVVLDIDSDRPHVTIEQGYARAWKLAIRGADRLGYIVEERDEKAGKLTIRLGKVGVDEGFAAGHTMLGLGREVYSLSVIDEGGETQVVVLTASGGVDNSKAARDFLARMYEKLQ